MRGNATVGADVGGAECEGGVVPELVEGCGGALVDGGAPVETAACGNATVQTSSLLGAELLTGLGIGKKLV